ncbi:hypothetical protein [Methylobacterium iners]|uniref:MobA/VirD2-like nuclease domain-containing protein n=1 Tax=Methylobacterium iners TaxID=418707 RepID=A0ABQ4S2T7_9HYPH|nr:hypothetical protein [Methylobacterium iners]GJD97445.1 hypothetical protein OCOJLMKI_4676 [Methylobacterium iners]
MISGAMRGKGGDALARHLLKPENDSVEVIAPRGLGSPDLVGQVRELVALSLGGRTDSPCYHVHCDPDLAIEDNDGARRRWWHLFEQEFGLTSQPYCGAVHVKHARRHEHRVYGLVRRDGGVVDLAWDYIRREKVSRIVEHQFGLPPVPSKHARAIAHQLVADGRPEVARWLEAAGMLGIERPVAPLSPQERLVQERTGIKLGNVRAAALAAWHASTDGEGLRVELAARGLRLHAGRAGPVVVDAGGGTHLVTRLVGTASKAADGNRIPAAAVRARLAGLPLTQAGDGNGSVVGAARPAGHVVGGDPGGAGSAGGAGGLGAGRLGGGAEGPDGGRRGAGGRDPDAPLSRLRRLPAWRRGRLAARLSGLALRDSASRMKDIDRARASLGNGLARTDMHGVGQLAPPAPF